MARFLFVIVLALASCAPQVTPPDGVGGVGVGLEPHFTGLTKPTDLRFVGDGRALATQQEGTVVRLGDGKNKAVLDLRERVGCCGEKGLLSLALHPDFARNGLLFLYATDKTGATVLSRVRLDVRTLAADPDSYKVLLHIPDPGPTHNGGQLQFGSDGFLYLSTGDGLYRPSWLGAPPYAQETKGMLGKLLRFQVDEAGLSVPADNPFVKVEGAEAAVWAYGLRNPWRFAFDRKGGALYVADVGETAFEEINVQRLRASRGANYGWPLADGPRCRMPGGCDGFVPPAFSYTHAEGCSVTGGYVYRGAALPELTGRYLYGDFCSGTIWAAAQRGGVWRTRVLADTSLTLSSFAQDPQGEVYVLDYAGGVIYRLTGVN